MAETMRMLHDLVLIRPAKPVTKTETGLVVLGDLARGTPQRGLVLDVGPGKVDPKTGVRVPPPCQKDDVVIFSTSDIKHIELNKEPLVIVPASEILMRVDLSDDGQQPAS